LGDILQTILGPDTKAGLLVILNLIIIETMLSVDNAAVMATMVMKLPEHDRARALRFGIMLGYVFRGLCLLFASWLISIWWLKVLGGLYLLYLSGSHIASKALVKQEEAEGAEAGQVVKQSWIYRYTTGKLGLFWATVLSVELMDLTFSLDNVFAAVAFTDNIYLIWIGVFIGILAMRFVAQAFVRLMHVYPFMENVAFGVIGILGLKLVASMWVHLQPDSAMAHAVESETADTIVSGLTIAMFVLPLLTSRLFNWPHHTSKSA